MTNLLSSLPMEHVTEFLKVLAGLIAALAPLWAALRQPRREMARELEDRYARLRTFFDAGAEQLHPLLMETAFGAAVGHTRLTARGIPLILRQRSPSSFMHVYLKVKDYLAPTEDGSKFELRSLASHTGLRRTLVVAAFLVYGLFVLTAVWLLLFAAPQLASQGSWTQLAGALALAVLFASAGAYFLIAGSKLHWAYELCTSQR